MSAMTQGYSFSPANPTGPQIGFGPAPIEQNPMDRANQMLGGDALTGLPIQTAVAGPAQQPQQFQTSWEMAGYPTLDAWKTALGGTGGAQIGGGPAPLSVTPTPAPAGGKSGFNINDLGGLFGQTSGSVLGTTANAAGLTPLQPVAKQFGNTIGQVSNQIFGGAQPTPTPTPAQLGNVLGQGLGGLFGATGLTPLQPVAKQFGNTVGQVGNQIFGGAQLKPINQVQPNRYTRTRNRPINSGKPKPGFY